MESTTQWFVKCDVRDNENLACLLDMHQVTSESLYVGLLDTKDRKHDVWLLPTRLLTMLREAKVVKPEIYRFRFFVRDSQDDKLRSASFLELKKLDPQIQNAAAALAALEKRRARNQELNDK